MSDLETSDLRGIIQDDGPPNAGPTLRNPALTLATTIYRDRTAGTGGYWQNMPDGAGVLGWVPMVAGGGSGASASWPKYVVSNQPTPVALYTTVQSAIDAAVADGHGSATPAVVQCLPGTYTEDITVPAGIAVAGIDGSLSNDVTIVGSVTCVDASPLGGTFSISNLQLIGGPITCTGPLVPPPGFQTVFILNDLAFQQTVGGVVYDTQGTLVIAGLPIFVRPGPTPGYPVIDVLRPNSQIFAHNLFAPNGAGDVAVRINGGSGFFYNSDITGGLQFTAPADYTFTAGSISTDGAQSPLDIAAGATIVLLDTSVAAGVSTTPIAVGAGTVSFSNCRYRGPSGFLVASTLNTNAIEHVGRRHPMRTVVGPGTFTFEPTDECLIVDTTGGAATVELPALDTLPSGLRLMIKAIGTAAPLTIDAGAFSIDGGTSTQTLAYANACFQVQADRAQGTWLMVGDHDPTAWGEYTVASALSGVGAAHQTIASAQAAATAAGHGAGNPAVILVLSDLTENVVLLPGLNLQGLGSEERNAAELGTALLPVPTGQFTITGEATLGAGDGEVSVTNLTFRSGAGVPLTLGGATNVVVGLRGVACRRDVGVTALAVTNTGSTTVAARQCAFATSNNAAAAAAVVDVTTGLNAALTMRLTGCYVAGSSLTHQAILSDVPVDLTECQFSAQLRFAAGVFGTSILRDTVVATSVQPTIELNGAPFKMYRGAVAMTPGLGQVGPVAVVSTAAPAQVQFVDVVFPGNRNLGINIVPFVSVLGSEPLPYVARPNTRTGFGTLFGAPIAGPVTLDHAEDVVPLDSTGLGVGPTVVTLPPVAQVPDGHRETIAHVFPAGSVALFSVVAAGADTINYGAVAAVSLAIGQAAEFQADAGLASWIYVGGV